MIAVAERRVAAIHQPQYLPWLGYFDKLLAADVFVYLDDVQYVKNEWKNRNKIKITTGTTWLTVPVNYRFGQTIREVTIADPDFGRRHCQALKTYYGRCPSFDEVYPAVEEVVRRPHPLLAELCIELTEVLLGFLGPAPPRLRSSTIEKREGPTTRLIDLCLAVQATHYLSGPAGRDYLDLDRFTEAGLAVLFHEYEHPVYPQRWDAFVSHLAVIDLLLNVGAERSREVLLSGRRNP
ncbi:MAG: hypothetical protein A2284_12210 [Deltaproteobacteria bacterium RIFOXYA12_FULL_61_11]|nr:MAG: hypothetical protein A2284_12210 [Deltaproteobacteria bacterium RIFOXYA12_FULL_61_11]